MKVTYTAKVKSWKGFPTHGHTYYRGVVTIGNGKMSMVWAKCKTVHRNDKASALADAKQLIKHHEEYGFFSVRHPDALYNT